MTENPSASPTFSEFRRGSKGPDLGSYTKIPSKLFGSGTVAALGSTVILVYVALCEHANRFESNSFKASDRALASETGFGTRTIHEARKTLIENGMISVARENGQSYTYTLCALSLKWIPLNERPRPKRQPRALHSLGQESQNGIAPPANLAEPA
jgi:hypothetical protein